MKKQSDNKSAVGNRQFARSISSLIAYCLLPTFSFSQCPPIYGIHWWTNDANTDLMNGKNGWTVEIINTVDGPNAIDGLISSIVSEGIFTPIVRINRNWGETVPGNPADYNQFAVDCQNIASNLYNNYGVKWFQIGNEMNLDGEYPPAGGCPASEYVTCFNAVYTAIKTAVPNANVLVGPVGPWNNQGPLTPAGSGVYYDVYFDYIVSNIGSQCDGYALHTYGFFNEGNDNNLSAPANTVANAWGFQAYQSQIKILQQYSFTQSKPIQITETNTLSHSSPPATSYTSGWMQQAFQEINNWNINNPNYSISSLCWFVNKDDGTWTNFALQSNAGNMPQARSDFSWTTANTNYTACPSVPCATGNPPAALQVNVPLCSNVNYTASLSWNNCGNNWWIDVSTDSNFSFYFNKNISYQTSTAAPTGFLCDSLFAPCPPATLSFQPNTTYYWRIWNGVAHTSGNSFNVPNCVGIQETVLNTEISVYPSIGRGEFFVYASSNIHLKEVSVYNTIGEIVLRTNDNKIILSTHPVGLYFMHIRTAQGIVNKKIIIHK